MAKQKSARCSTGHGTGVTPSVELRDLVAKGRHSRLFTGRPSAIAQGSVDRPKRTRAPRGPAQLWRQGLLPEAPRGLPRDVHGERAQPRRLGVMLACACAGPIVLKTGFACLVIGFVAGMGFLGKLFS